jgi:hypothetical protein
MDNVGVPKEPRFHLKFAPMVAGAGLRERVRVRACAGMQSSVHVRMRACTYMCVCMCVRACVSCLCLCLSVPLSPSVRPSVCLSVSISVYPRAQNALPPTAGV